MNKNFNKPYELIMQYGANFPQYSFSQLSTIQNCPYEYKLGLSKTKKQNVYGILGNLVHNIIEKFYIGEIKYIDMKNIFINNYKKDIVDKYQFFKDECKDYDIKQKYFDNLYHFFSTHTEINLPLENEKTIWADVNGNVFLGFIDSVFKDNGIYNIIDYKTGNINSYLGKNQDEKSLQLAIYKLGLNRLGILNSEIKCFWNFVQYCDIVFKHPNGKIIKKKKVERRKILEIFFDELMNSHEFIKTDLDSFSFNLMLLDLMGKNDFENLPKEFKNLFEIKDCLVEIELNDKDLENKSIELELKAKDVRRRILEDDWNIDDIPQNKLFYCKNLCSVSEHCKYLKKVN